MPNRVIHFEIQADDIDRAKDFYEKAFGWKIEKMMSDENMEYWSITTGEQGPGINGGLYKRPSENPINTYDCTILVDDLGKAIDDVKKNGGQIIHEKMEIPNVGLLARAQDTEGNKFGMIQPTGWKP